MPRSTRLAQQAGVEQAQAPPLPPGLVYVTDARPGIRRVPRGQGFAYRTSSGSPLRDEQELARIRSLAVPPAYTAVWICPLPNGHLEATGRDARGRKQYRYHSLWREQRDEYKFDRLRAFGRALPRIRARVERDLKTSRASSTKPSRELVLATIVRLLDTTFLRVGNDEYARGNDSYGLTTLRNRHAGVRGSVLELKFRGKSGKPHEVSLDNPRVARVVRRCQQMPGQDLFAYEDEDGNVRDIGSSDVNDYLAEAAGDRFTAKDFRTWHGTVHALELIQLACNGQGDQRAGPKEVIAEVARRLGNTAAVCKKDLRASGSAATRQLAGHRQRR